ncbi:hypothetical protein [Streptomyces spiralis]|uniref:hypothetical protein n=1 Tax=Streptomyces spiralis TaxID=66376 RepID=UPI00340B34FE
MSMAVFLSDDVVGAGAADVPCCPEGDAGAEAEDGAVVGELSLQAVTAISSAAAGITWVRLRRVAGIMVSS